MSARVFNPPMSEMRRVMRGGGHLDLSESETLSPRDNSSVERIKKCLFGRVDHDECKLYAQQQLESHTEQLSKKWNFDFKKGEPRPSDEGCVYEWKVFKSNEAVPEAYALSRLPFLNQHADNDPPVKRGTEGTQGRPSSSFTSPTRSVQSSTKQTVITDFMRKQKTTRRIPAILKSEPVPSVKEEEPATKKART